MTKFKILISILCLLFVFSVHAQEADLYQNVLMPGGPFQGQILNTSKLRTYVLLSDANNILPEPLSKSYGYIANVSHNGKRYVARVRLGAPMAVNFIYEKFTNMMGGHADLVYTFNKKMPLELIYEIRDGESEKDFSLIRLSKPILLQHILLTAEAVKIVGDVTPLAKGGIENKFGMAYRMTSIPERLIEPVIVEGRKTTVFDVPFDKSKVVRSFWDTVNTQSKIGMSENYNLVSNNCITSAVRGLANGLTAAEEARVEAELARTFLRIGALSRQDLTDAEIKEMLSEYAKMLRGGVGGAVKSKATFTPIMERSFFTDWLTEEQKATIVNRSCKQIFN